MVLVSPNMQPSNSLPSLYIPLYTWPKAPRTEVVSAGYKASPIVFVLFYLTNTGGYQRKGIWHL